MDLVYGVSRKTSSRSQHENEWLIEDNCLITISTKNTVAWTTRTEINDTTNTTWASHVYVADLNVPWQYHKVMSSKWTVTTLEWNIYGTYILIGDCSGTVSIYTMNDHMFNDWVQLGSTVFEAEHILGGAFFHSGNKLSLMTEKKDSVSYYEKFNYLRFAPSVRQKGGCALEGCIVISKTGLIGVIVLTKTSHNNTTLLTTAESLAVSRYEITSVDICYGKNGHFLIATSCQDTQMPIKCYEVSTKKTMDDKLVVTAQALPSFYLKVTHTSKQVYKVARVRFIVREDADSVIVAANGETNSVIEVWELVENAYPVNSVFKKSVSLGVGPPAGDPGLKTITWRLQNSYAYEAKVLSVTTSKLCVSNSLPPQAHIIVAYSNGSLTCFLKDSLKQLGFTSVNNMIWAKLDNMKRSRMSVVLSCIDLSWLGNVLACIDRKGQFFLYKMINVAELNGPMTVPNAVTQLEYCLITGFDPWDILISLRPNMLEAVCDKFTDNFQRQSAAVQQLEYNSFLQMKINLIKIMPNGNSKSIDLTYLSMLNSISTAFKSLLRPSDLASPDKGPAESLAAAIADPTVSDVDKVLLNLGAKEFTVEPSTLQSLQQLIQWIANLALNIVGRYAEHKKNNHYDIMSDSCVLNTLRELIVIIRIWGLLRSSCLPVFICCFDSLDVLATLYKLLSRMIHNKDVALTGLDESLVDECMVLQNQVVIPSLTQLYENVCDVANPLFYQTFAPLCMEYGSDPVSSYSEDCLLAPSPTSRQYTDIIRHVYLGRHPPLIKSCTRCGGRTQVLSMARTAAVRAWEGRWVQACRCGGHWNMNRAADKKSLLRDNI
ncbi:hypothetical protein M8J77_023055 [Diaphorina citri]|nr:hypothetical protein M8J77_023055 [Diaphorina citri]